MRLVLTQYCRTANLTNAQILSDLTVCSEVLTEDSSSGSSSVTPDIFSSTQGTLLSESDLKRFYPHYQTRLQGFSTISRFIQDQIRPEIHGRILKSGFLHDPGHRQYFTENVSTLTRAHHRQPFSFHHLRPRRYPDIYTRMSITQAFIPIQSCVLNYGAMATQRDGPLTADDELLLSTLTKEQATLFQRNSLSFLDYMHLPIWESITMAWKLARCGSFFPHLWNNG